MFDLPEPLGPMIAVMPGSKTNVVGVAKLLKPCSSRRFSRVVMPVPSSRRYVVDVAGVPVPRGLVVGHLRSREVRGRMLPSVRTPGNCAGRDNCEGQAC